MSAEQNMEQELQDLDEYHMYIRRKTKKERIYSIVCCVGEGKCCFHTNKFRKAIRSKYAYIASVFLTILAIVLSTAMKYINKIATPLPTSWFVVNIILSIVMFCLSIWFCIEILLRVFAYRVFDYFYTARHGIMISNVIEIIVVYADLACNIYAFSLSLQTGQLSSLFGSMITLRLLLMMVYAPGFGTILEGIKKSIITLILLGIFMALILYGVVVLSFVLFSSEVVPSNASCEICKTRFPTIEKTMYTMFQALTGDSWASSIALVLSQQTFWGRAALYYFLAFEILSNYLFITLITAVIINAVMADEPEALYDDDEVNLRKMNISRKVTGFIETAQEKSFLRKNSVNLEALSQFMNDDNTLSPKHAMQKRRLNTTKKFRKDIIQQSQVVVDMLKQMDKTLEDMIADFHTMHSEPDIKEKQPRKLRALVKSVIQSETERKMQELDLD